MFWFFSVAKVTWWPCSARAMLILRKKHDKRTVKEGLQPEKAKWTRIRHEWPDARSRRVAIHSRKWVVCPLLKVLPQGNAISCGETAVWTTTFVVPVTDWTSNPVVLCVGQRFFSHDAFFRTQSLAMPMQRVPLCGLQREIVWWEVLRTGANAWRGRMRGSFPRPMSGVPNLRGRKHRAP